MIYFATMNVVTRSFEGSDFLRNVGNGFVGKVIWEAGFSTLSFIVRAAEHPRVLATIGMIIRLIIA